MLNETPEEVLKVEKESKEINVEENSAENMETEIKEEAIQD